jgi:hypothetical protein
MRKRFVQIGLELQEVGADYVPEPRTTGPMVMGDIQPYKSTIDGSIIPSRSVHRAHLRQHGCVEVGNERLPGRKYDIKPQGLRQDMLRAWDQLRRT